MRIFIIKAYIIMFFLTGFLHSQNVKDDVLKTNYDVYNEMLNKNLDVIENRFVLLGKDKIYSISVHGNKEESEYLFRAIKQKLNSYRIITDADSMNSDYKVLFDNVKLKTTYNKISGSVLWNSKVDRQIELSYKCTIRQKSNDSLVFSNNIRDINKDEFYLDRFDEVEKGDYDFLKSKLPERNIFDKLFIPAVVVLASAATIILFFVIRSK